MNYSFAMHFATYHNISILIILYDDEDGIPDTLTIRLSSM